MKYYGNYINLMHFPSKVVNDWAITEIEKSSKDYVKANCNMSEVLNQQKLLREVILSSTKQNFFTVFNMECSTGKTYTIIQSIPYYFQAINKGLLPQKGILIVLRENLECDKYADELNKLYSIKKVALSFNSDKYKTDDKIDNDKRKKLLGQVKNYPVVFITHSQYNEIKILKESIIFEMDNDYSVVIDC